VLGKATNSIPSSQLKLSEPQPYRQGGSGVPLDAFLGILEIDYTLLSNDNSRLCSSVGHDAHRSTWLLANHSGYVTSAVLVVILRTCPTDLCQLFRLTALYRRPETSRYASRASVRLISSATETKSDEKSKSSPEELWLSLAGYRARPFAITALPLIM
jgi:hypothetical protein